MWPEGLHVTFDNTSGDCKNTGTFRFLGMLVALGVFCYITVSTLLVGHTHDIVDQMFSVWSGQLSSNNAPTLEVLHTLFRNKYSSKIYEVERLKKAAKDGNSAAVLSKR
jgi:ABC-type lipoprotein release transport system permease subunit